MSTFLGKQLQHLVHTQEGDFLVNTSTAQALRPKQAVSLQFPPEKTIIIDR